VTKFHIIIPARYNSSRFPGKLLELLGDKTVIRRVYEQAMLAKPTSITIVTDDTRIYDHATEFGATAVMSQNTHESGTDRIAEYVASANFDAEDIIVNVQGDEPLIPPALITQVATVLANSDSHVATLAAPIINKELWHDPNVVKVVCNKNRTALYFSRSLIPGHRNPNEAIINPERHIGLYAYRASFLRTWQNLPTCDLELNEALEQLRVLWNGYQITVALACCEPGQDINTPLDLVRAKSLISS
jgi:3-deoxy-manno-octulosonate cytidylyltransferase (CMP-KDO synthetase)